ncbi:hypothetical protein METBIDRAFT_90440 [Metschnikowia bicuspidata var. bicuspidata NRRL YB-4993]|uniref:C2H2-type domain-containing protein n=1 Tax=Metschnikowia bicuspidata var. bicuspidata NRRL YB-4993 TaxID=869754 RepID=A0A1A0HFR4_9ASCO|nr:hypothetical protein METBIDRAFT_90440 [Metschnikowia bicuspidata var. bicuspidata NRRL YB-4993]OBA22698.1 hypothetical protein METBIDRAFT_90440 [Metschnikowia bicuspidata var. bicuspidata NRRL YB-4993]
MARQLPLGLEPLFRDQHPLKQQHFLLPLQALPAAPPPAAAAVPDWIPPPALLATVNSDAIDLNDEVFFNYNAAPAYTTDAYGAGPGAAVPLLLLLAANFDFGYAAMPPHELASSPLKHAGALDSHYSHTRRFLLAVDQLNRMSLQAAGSLKLSSPDLYSMLPGLLASTEERTVDPRRLFGGPDGASPPGPGLAGATRYVLPSSVLSPSLLTFFAKLAATHDLLELSAAPAADPQGPLSATAALQALPAYTLPSQKPPLALNNPLNPYVMNDECVSAITYWLNNTADVILDKPAPSGPRTPLSVMKPGWTRRNLIQVVSPRADDRPAKTLRTLPMDQKRRRRKSVNTSSAIPEASFATSLNLASAHVHTQGFSHSPPQQAGHYTGHAPLDLRAQVRPLTLPLSHKEEPKTANVYAQDTYDAMDVAVPGPGSADSARDGLFKYTRDIVESIALMDVDVHSSHVAPHAHIDLGHPHAAEPGDDEPKPFPCPDCDKQFKRLEHLKRHIRSVHSNIRPFHCKYCEKKFLRSDNLAQHLKTHFKVDANGTATIIYGNPNPLGRTGRKKSAGDVDMEGLALGKMD